MRLGILPNFSGLNLFDELVRLTVQAEADGFDHCWFVQLAQSGYDPLTVIAVAGQQTKRIHLGTGVVPIYTRHPIGLAQQALTAQVATGGRLLLGLGLSHQPVVEQVWGLSYDQPARHMREYLTVLNGLLQSGRVDFEGDVYHVHGQLQVPNAAPCPVFIAALAPAMLRLAGEVTAGTVTWMVGRPALASHIAPRIQAAAAAAGREPPRVVVMLPLVVTDRPAEARAEIDRVMARYGQLPNYRRVLDIGGAAGPGDVAVVGDEAQIEAELRAYAKAGATDFVAVLLPLGAQPQAHLDRAWALLKSLVGRL